MSGKVLAAACLGMLGLGVNGTAIMAALPTMRHDIGLSPTQLEWAINAYLLVSAACIIPGGKACDQFGARRVSIAGLALFALASAVVAVGRFPAAILTGRALQGLAAALAVPGTLAALPSNRSGAGSGIINACSFLGGSIGVAGGAVAFAFGSLPATMAMIVVLALGGVLLCRGLAAGS